MAALVQQQKKKDEWFKSRRILVMTELLRDREHTTDQLCKFFQPEATRRDVQRDLEQIESCIDDFRRIPARPPRYCIRTQANSLHPVETLAVYAATRLVYHRASGHSSHCARRWPGCFRAATARGVSGPSSRAV